MSLTRRRFLLATGAAVGVPAVVGAQAIQNVVVIGGGFGGATAAKYLRRLNPALRVTLIEPATEFVMCPLSNRVLHGKLVLRDIARPYQPLVDRYRLRWIRAAADAVDPDRREVAVGRERIAYDRLIVAPGVDYVYEGIPGLEAPEAQERWPHAWKAGVQTQRLRDMLLSLPDGGVVAMHIPKVPYRCPPGPYERASLIASYLRTRKPRSKLLVFDSNPEIQAKKGLFEGVWATQYRKLIEYVPNAEIERVDVGQNVLEFRMQGRTRADVVNLIPPQRAGAIARRTGLANVADRWCGVDFLTYQSTVRSDIHVLGDSIAGSPGMPKSGHMANQQAKVCAGAIAAQSLGLPVPDEPIIANTCYSFVSDLDAIHVATVFRYDRDKRVMVPAPGAGGVSVEPSKTEGLFAVAWGTNILADSLE